MTATSNCRKHVSPRSKQHCFWNVRWASVQTICLALLFVSSFVSAFVFPTLQHHTTNRCLVSSKTFSCLKMSTSVPNYVRQDDGPRPKGSQQKEPLYPKVGDIVRYYDLDGGRKDGQVLVGRISFIQKQLAKKETTSTNTAGDNNNDTEQQWLVELAQLEDIGDGYFAPFSMRQRNSKKALRRLEEVSPIAASFVKSENAYKVPRELATGLPIVRAEQYDVKGYLGPFGGANAIDTNVVAQDAVLYGELKGQLLRNAAIVGLIGTIIADLAKGTEDAVIYAVGVVASIAYLFFLSVKTDTIASPNAKFGSNIANLRFLMPIFVVAGIAFYNQSRGEANPILVPANPFDRITSEQFAAAMFGFLTYRIPLFLSQIQGVFLQDESGNAVLPGSAGVVQQMVQPQKQSPADLLAASAATSVPEQQLISVLVISGPQGTGRSALVQRFMEEESGRGIYVLPKRMDRYQDGATFERMERRGEFLDVDATGRFGLTKQSILSAATEGSSSDSSTDTKKPVVVVVDASVDLARKLTNLSGTRLIGVWVGLRSVEDFQTRLGAMIDSGEIKIPEDETKESILRARIREIVKEIEFGVVSGIFEFTILNDDEEESLQQLKEAAAYALR